MALSRTSSSIAINEGTHTATTQSKELGKYIPLFRAIHKGDWNKAQQFFNKDKDALTDKINVSEDRALHIATCDPQNYKFLEKLLEQIDPQSLPNLANIYQQTILHFAALLDNARAAKMVVEKNPNLLFIGDNEKALPIERAALNSHETTFRYLLQVCKQHIGLSQKEGYRNPFEGENGVRLLGESISAGFLDVAFDLLQDYPELATTMVTNFRGPLWCIATKWDAYPSSKQYNFYEKIVYSHVHTKNYRLDHTDYNQDIENKKTSTANLLTERTKSYAYRVFQTIYDKFWKFALLHVPHVKHLHEDKVKHNIALSILEFISEEVGELICNHVDHYGDALILAVKNNTPEVIEMLIRFFPESMWTESNGYSLLQLSIINRCENVYNYIVHNVSHAKYYHNVKTDSYSNNLLHLAGKLAPTHKLNRVTGAALQMQRELQWFQEVRKLMRPKEREAQNSENETPIMVFRKEHEDLRQKGEEWMKKTADSYTITAALIITTVFAAAITVPGGNNGETGRAIYKTKPSFIVFIISDAISLFTSTTSLLLFLSILTARYADEDFLYKLPKRLILGLVMLFMSVTTMLIAFSATLYITSGEEKSWTLIPIGVATCLPITSFVTLQLPLLYDLISSTYGRGIFGKRTELRITS